MDRNEKIVKLCTKTGVSAEDAMRALDACNDDILDAVLYLEALGKVQGPQTSTYTTEAAGSTATKQAEPEDSSSFAKVFGRICGWIGSLIKKGNENFLDITKGDKCYLSLPLTVFVLLLIPFFSIIAILLIVGLFFDFHYRFRGPAFAEDGTTNQTMDKASKMVGELKSDFKDGLHESQAENVTENESETPIQ